MGESAVQWCKLYGKSCGGLSKHFKFQRGIRQDCPLSGQLYSLAIEPFLFNVRNKLRGFHLPNSPLSMPLTVATYAEDANIFIIEQANVNKEISKKALAFMKELHLPR